MKTSVVRLVAMLDYVVHELHNAQVVVDGPLTANLEKLKPQHRTLVTGAKHLAYLAELCGPMRLDIPDLENIEALNRCGYTAEAKVDEVGWTTVHIQTPVGMLIFGDEVK